MPSRAYLKDYTTFGQSICLAILFATTNLPASAAVNGGKCTKVGQTQVTKSISYVCAKSGKKTVWQVKTSSTAATTTATTTTTVAAEKYVAPTTTGTSTDDCKLVEASPERKKWGNIFVAFPPIGGNFEPTGTFKVALVPIDWADLPGEANPLARATDKMNLFTDWFDTVSEGKVSFVWSTYDIELRGNGRAIDSPQLDLETEEVDIFVRALV